MEFRIQCDPRIATRAAAMALEGLTLFRDALAIRNDAEATELLQRLEEGRAFRARGLPEDLLAETGERFLRGELPMLTPDDLVIVDAVLSVVPHANDLELISLRAGTLGGVFRDLQEWLEELLKEAFKASVGLLPWNSKPNLKGLHNLVPDAGRPRQVASGLLALGALRLRTGYRVLGATSVQVIDDRESGGPGVPINPLFRGGPKIPIDFPRPEVHP